MVAQQHGRGTSPLLLGNLHDRLSLHDGPACGAERRVCHDVDPLLVAEVDNLLLRQVWVVLDLVDCGHDRAMWQKLFEIAFAVIADADALCLAGLEELLHQLPRLDVVVVPDNVALAIGKGGELVVVTYKECWVSLIRQSPRRSPANDIPSGFMATGQC